MTFTLNGRNCKKALDACEAEIKKLDKLFNLTDKDSEVFRLNESAGEYVLLSYDTVSIIKTAIEEGATTDYLFDISISPIVEAFGFYDKSFKVPDNDEIDKLLSFVDAGAIEINGNSIKLAKNQKIDLGGIAKGYLSDRVKEILKEYNINSAVISLGGSILTVGGKEDGLLWNVGVEDPFSQSMYIGILSITDTTIVTSGDYERYFISDGIKYHHIFDPRTGYPTSNELVSVTIIMDSGTTAEVLSTALFVMGEDKALKYWQQVGGFEMILINKDKEIYITSNLKDRFTLTDEGFRLYWLQQ